MPLPLTEKQKLLLWTLTKAGAVYLVFRYLLPLVLPFVVAVLLAWVIRPMVRFFQEKLHLPQMLGAVVVLALVLGGLGTGLYFLGKMAVEQLIRLGQQLPQLWQQCYDSVWQFCSEVERDFGMRQGRITDQIRQPDVSLSSLLGSSFQGGVVIGKAMITWLVTIFVTIGATLITTTQLEALTRSMEQSLFGKEIQGILQTLVRVGKAYGKTQLMVMGCTVIFCGGGLTLLGDPYALLWAMVIGVVDALPLFGAGLILWPWMIVSALRGQLVWTVGLAVIYGVANLTRQWLEARYMGDRIGLSALENLLAMYVGLKLFGILGLFLGPVGYLMVKESGQRMDSGKKT